MRPFNKLNCLLQPTKVEYSFSQLSSGYTGLLDATRTAGKVYGYAGGLSMLVLNINASSAYVSASSEAGTGSDLMTVSIDGGATQTLTLDNGHFTIFKDLVQQERTVCIMFGAAYYNIPFFYTSRPPVLTVQGFSPTVVVPSAWVQPGDGSSLSISSAFMVGMPNSTVGYIPNSTPGYSYMVSGSNVPSTRIKTSARNLWVTSTNNYVFVSVDGGQATRYYSPLWSGNVRVTQIKLDGNLHTYNVWQSRANGSNCIFSVGTDAPLNDIGIKRRLDQYGDSITDGAGSTSSGDVDTMQTAASLGMCGSAYGIAGETISQLLTRLPTLLAGKTVTSSDIAIIAEGRNNTGGSISAPILADYVSIINSLLSKGYGKVFCRGIIGSTVSGANTYWPAENASLLAAVTSVANANVIFIDTSGWPVTFGGTNGGIGIQLLDGTHPTDTGYITMAGYAITAYTPLI